MARLLVRTREVTYVGLGTHYLGMGTLNNSKLTTYPAGRLMSKLPTRQLSSGLNATYEVWI